MTRAGVQVLLGLDNLGIAVVKVSHTPDVHVMIVHNDEVVDQHYPNEEDQVLLANARKAEENAKSRDQKVAEMLDGKIPAAATTEELIALVQSAQAEVDAQ